MGVARLPWDRDIQPPWGRTQTAGGATDRSPTVAASYTDQGEVTPWVARTAYNQFVNFPVAPRGEPGPPA